MEDSIRSQLVPGAIVEVTQQIARRDQAWTHTVRGRVLAFEQQPTGSWFAHARDDRLWLDRLVLQLDDGEIISLILDDYSHITIKTPPAAAQPAVQQAT
jgi:hypothetical protein